MESPLIIKILIFLSLAVVASNAALSTPIQTYWSSELPNTLMPKSVKYCLPHSAASVNVTTGAKPDHRGRVDVGKGGVSLISISQPPPKCQIFFYKDAATEGELRDNAIAALYFKGTDLHEGTIMNLKFVNTTSGGEVFLPRTEAEKIPFSSQKTSEIFNRFSLTPNSEEAKVMKQTIDCCEESPIKGEKKYCATSLEAMVDFCKSELGKKVSIIATDTGGETSKQDYTISGVRKMQNKGQAVVCHKMSYAYAVFNCHKIPKTQAYMVSLVGANGAKVKAAAVCHKDTSTFNPKNFAFQVLKVKPGTVPVCHFLPEGHIVWVAN